METIVYLVYPIEALTQENPASLFSFVALRGTDYGRGDILYNNGDAYRVEERVIAVNQTHGHFTTAYLFVKPAPNGVAALMQKIHA